MKGCWCMILVFALSGDVWAGMPAYTMSDLAEARLEAISFFVLLLLLVAWAVRWLWNALRRDFARLPRLTYGRALALVVLLGLLFDLVLLMIAGTREIMTPEAWEAQGAVYRLKSWPGVAVSPGEAAAGPGHGTAR